MSKTRGICHRGGKKGVPRRWNGNGATATSRFRQLDWDASAKEQVWVRETFKSDGEWSRIPGVPHVGGMAYGERARNNSDTVQT